MVSAIFTLVFVSIIVLPTVINSYKDSKEIRKVKVNNERMKQEIIDDVGEKEFNEMIVNSITKEDINRYFREEYNK